MPSLITLESQKRDIETELQQVENGLKRLDTERDFQRGGDDVAKELQLRKKQLKGQLADKTAEIKAASKGKPEQSERFLDRHEGYVAAEAKREELGNKRAAIVSELDQVQAKLGSMIESRQTSAIDMEAAKLLGQDDHPAITQGQLRERVAELKKQVAVHDRALQMQDDVIRQELLNASRQICQEVGEEHRDIVRRLASAVVELATLVEAEAYLRTQLEAEGIRICDPIRPMVFVGTGNLSDRNSRARAFLRECIQNGYTTTKELGISED